MPLPAVERIPVEVWLRIIRFALALPLNPAPGDDIFNYRNVFLTVCNSDQAALAHENNVASFRLVCKSWDSTVKQFRQTSILCDFGKKRSRGNSIPFGPEDPEPERVPDHLFQKPTPEELPSVTRIEAWTTEGYCYCFRPTCRYKKFSTSRDHPARDLPKDSPVAPRRGESVSTIKSLLIGMKIDDDYLCSLLDAMPALRALSCRIRDKPMWKTIFQTAPCQRLTHLQVRVSWAPFCRSFSRISLPELVYFGVIFHLPPDTSQNANPPLNNVEWCHQPKLRYLELEGILLDGRQDEFYAFLAADRPNLSGLILRVYLPSYANSKYVVPPNLAALFPNITSLGVDMGDLLDGSLPPDPNTRITTLIPFFNMMHYVYNSKTPTTEILEAIRKMYREWKPERIMLPTTWEAEEQFVKGFKLSASTERPKLFYLPHYVQFFQVLKEDCIMVVDRDGQSTETAEGRRYIEFLEIYGLDKYDNGFKIYEEWEVVRPRTPVMSGAPTYGFTDCRTRFYDSD